MLVKQGSLVKQAILWNAIKGAADVVAGIGLAPFKMAGKALGYGVGAAVKAPFKAVGAFGRYAFKNPAGAVGVGGVALSDYGLAKDGISAVSSSAATPYRYF